MAYLAWTASDLGSATGFPKGNMRPQASEQEAPDELLTLIRCGIEREMPSIDDVHFGLRHVAAIGFRLRGVEREFILTPDHQQARLLLAHPGLPFRVGVNVRPVVVEEVDLNIALAGLVEEVKFIGPEIGVIA